jgi:cytochrome c-type biogenesis protein CcmH/NrfG
MLYYRAAATEEGHVRAGHGSYNMMMSRARVSRQDLIRRTNANRMRKQTPPDQHAYF